ncbi:MAG: hypothetical protein ACLQUY_20295 [Ktedonobacterales bacterium]
MAEDFPSTDTGKSYPMSDKVSQSQESSRHHPLPLPYDFPLAPPESAAGKSMLLPGASGIYPQVPEDKWVRQEELVPQQVHFSITGQHPVARPKTRTIKPPKRFRPVSRWRSIAVLSMVLLLTVLSCIGLLKLGAIGASLLHPGVMATPILSPISSPTPTLHPQK